MPYGSPSYPTSGTVITVDYARTNIIDPLNWLRLLTGNADPPASNYVAVSTSTAGAAWQKVSGDVLADLAVTAQKIADLNVITSKIGDGAVTAAKLQLGAVVTHLGYTPANRAGDTFSGAVTFAAGAIALSASNGLNALVVRNSSSDPNAPSLSVLNANSTAFEVLIRHGSMQLGHATQPVTIGGSQTVNGNLTVLANADVAGAMGAQELDLDGSTGGYSLRTLGAIRARGDLGGQNVQDRQYHFGSQLAATISNFAATVATLPSGSVAANGVTTAAIADGAVTEPKLALANAPSAGQFLGWDGSQLVWATPAGGGGGDGNVPAGAIVLWPNATVPAGGWVFYTALNERFPLGAGGVWTLGAAGGTVQHGHTANLQHAHGHATAHSHAATSLNVGGSIGAPSATNGLATAGGVNLPTADHSHSHTLDVTGSTDTASAGSSDNALATNQAIPADTNNHMPPYRVVNYIQKT